MSTKFSTLEKMTFQGLNNFDPDIIEMKESPWQLSTFANINKFVIFAPNELHNLPSKVRTEIIRIFGSQTGFAILLDKSASIEMAKIKLKSVVFIPYDLEQFQDDPLKSEKTVKRCFETRNPYLTPTIRLKHGFTRYNPNPSVAFVGSRSYLQQQLNVEDAIKTTTSLHLVLLPLSTHYKDIVRYVTNETRFDGRYSQTMEVGACLGQYLEEGGTRRKNTSCVLVCVSMHSRPVSAKSSSTEEEAFLMVNLPSGKRNLGENTSAAAGRIFLEQTGIMRSFSEASCAYSFLTSDKASKIFVEEVNEEVASGFLPALSRPSPPIASPSKGSRKILSSLSMSTSPSGVSSRLSDDFEALVRLSDSPGGGGGGALGSVSSRSSKQRVGPILQEYGTRVVMK